MLTMNHCRRSKWSIYIFIVIIILPSRFTCSLSYIDSASQSYQPMHAKQFRAFRTDHKFNNTWRYNTGIHALICPSVPPIASFVQHTFVQRLHHKWCFSQRRITGKHSCESGTDRPDEIRQSATMQTRLLCNYQSHDCPQRRSTVSPSPWHIFWQFTKKTIGFGNSYKATARAEKWQKHSPACKRIPQLHIRNRINLRVRLADVR